VGRFLSFPSFPLLAATSVRDVVVVEDACRAVDTAGSHVAAWKRMHEVGVERVLRAISVAEERALEVRDQSRRSMQYSAQQLGRMWKVRERRQRLEDKQ